MRPPPLFLPPSGDSNAAKPSHHQDANAPLLNHDALAQTGADSGSCGSSRDGDWDDTDEGTAQHDLFFQELRALPSVFASCALPLLLSSAAAVGETIIAAWLGPQALLAYAAATFIQAPITSIAGAMVDACGMLSVAPSFCTAFPLVTRGFWRKPSIVRLYALPIELTLLAQALKP